MDIKIPIKRSAVYTHPITLKIERELKDMIQHLSSISGADRPDVPELLRMGLRDVVEKAYRKYTSAA